MQVWALKMEGISVCTMFSPGETIVDSKVIQEWLETLWTPTSLERQARFLELLYRLGSYTFQMAEYFLLLIH